jgi:hypothetical protein
MGQAQSHQLLQEPSWPSQKLSHSPKLQVPGKYDQQGERDFLRLVAFFLVSLLPKLPERSIFLWGNPPSPAKASSSRVSYKFHKRRGNRLYLGYRG